MTDLEGPKVKDSLDRANPNTIADQLRLVGIGSVLRGQIPQVIRRAVPAAYAGVDATVEAVVLPDDAKAASILRATAISGTVTGELAPQAFGTTPATGQVAVSPSGDIAVLAADAITLLDVVYVPERGDRVELILPVQTNALTIPAQFSDPSRGVVLLAEAEAITGTSVGAKEILVPGTAPAAGHARLNVAKTQVLFNGTDAVLSARVVLVVGARQDLGDVLESAATTV